MSFPVSNGNTPTTTAGTTKKESSSSSYTTLVAVGVAATVAAVGTVYYLTRPAQSKKKKKNKSTPAKKKRGKKKNKSQPQNNEKVASVTPGTAATQAPVAAASKPKAEAEAASATPAVPSDEAAASEASPAPVAASDTTATDATPAAEADAMEQGDSDKTLRSEGPISQAELMKFFENSNKRLNTPEVRAQVTKAYKEGEGRGTEKVLREIQGQVWESMGIARELGFNHIKEVVSKPDSLSDDLRRAILLAAAEEEKALSVAILGSEEEMQKQQDRLLRLQKEAITTLQLKATTLTGQEQQRYFEGVQQRFQELSAQMEQLAHGPEQIAARKNMSDEDLKVLLTGHFIMQQQMAQMQQMQGMQ